MKKSCIFFLLIFCCINIYATVAYAQLSVEEPLIRTRSIVAATEQLAVEKGRYNATNQRLESLRQEKQHQLDILQPAQIDENMLATSELNVAVAQADLEGVVLMLAEANQAVASTQNYISALQKQFQDANYSATNANKLDNQKLPAIQATLNYQRTLLQLELERVKILSKLRDTMQQIVEVRKDWKQQLQTRYQAYQENLRQRILNMQELNLEHAQQQWLIKLSQYNSQALALSAKGQFESPAYSRLTVKIFEAEERINLTRIQLDLARQKNQLTDLTSSTNQNNSLAKLHSTNRAIDVIITDLKNIQSLLERRIELIKQREQLDKQSASKRLISKNNLYMNLSVYQDLLSAYNEQQDKVLQLKQQAVAYKDNLVKNLNSALARRQGLPGLDMAAWLLFSEKLLHMPGLVFQALKALVQEITLAFSQLTAWAIGLISLTEVLWFLIWYTTRNYLRLMLAGLKNKEQSITANIFLVIFELVRRNIIGIALVGGAAILFVMSGISSKALNILISFSLIWFSFKIAQDLARISLFETMGDHSGQDAALYHNLKWMLLVGGILTAMMVMTQQLPVAYEVNDFFNRVFMLYVFVVAMLFLKGWRVIPSLLSSLIARKRRYLKSAIYLFSLLLPLIMLATAVIGIVGYVELAWTICRFAGLFLIVLTGYIVLRGFLSDGMELAYSICIRRISNGWLWSEALLKPLDNILRIALFLSAIVVLFALYGWDRHSAVVMKINDILQFHFFSIAGSPITLLSILEIIIVISMLVWAARWSREFAYRWLFANAKDLGVRNSLAVFSQYIVVILGVFIALQVLGIDMSGLKFVFGGLAVGLGFGLRDLANNFVSGVLLLIERPVRTGDLVTIGGYEGRVTHIGMRSMIVKTDDYTEVLVPNSEAFSRSFTNWTHRDTIVRTVIKLKLHHQDDPHFVQKLILQVFNEIPEVIHEPQPHVYLKEVGEALIEFDVHYFINLQYTTSQAAVRSKVLFTVFDRFKEHGIKPPYPQYDIHVSSIEEK